MSMIINPYRFGGAAISSPTEISNLYLWLDGADISTMWQQTNKTGPVTANNDNVYYWEDKQSSIGFIKATGAGGVYKTNVKNGESSVYFSGAGWLIATATSIFNVDFTAFVVYANNTANEVHCVLNSDGNDLTLSTDRLVFYADTRSTPKRLTGYPTNKNIDLLSQSSATTWYYTSCVLDQSTAAEGWLNGVSQGTGTPDAAVVETDTIVGTQSTNTNFLTGYISEVIVYHALLSATDRQRVESYLAAKWAI